MRPWVCRLLDIPLSLCVHFLPSFCLVFAWWLPAGTIRRRMRALPPTVSPGGSGASASGTNPASEKSPLYASCYARGPWSWLGSLALSLLLLRTLLAAKAVGIRPPWCCEGQSRAQPKGAARCLSGAWVTFPGRTLAPGPLCFSAEDAQVCIYLLLVKRVVLIVGQFSSCRRYFLKSKIYC